MAEALTALREALHPVTMKPLELPQWMQLVIASVIELDDRLTALTAPSGHDPDCTDDNRCCEEGDTI